MNSTQLQIINYLSKTKEKDIKNNLKSLWKENKVNFVIEHKFYNDGIYKISDYEDIDNKIEHLENLLKEINSIIETTYNECLIKKVFAYQNSIIENIHFLKKVKELVNEYCSNE